MTIYILVHFIVGDEELDNDDIPFYKNSSTISKNETVIEDSSSKWIFKVLKLLLIFKNSTVYANYWDWDSLPLVHKYFNNTVLLTCIYYIQGVLSIISNMGQSGTTRDTIMFHLPPTIMFHQ